MYGVTYVGDYNWQNLMFAIGSDHHMYYSPINVLDAEAFGWFNLGGFFTSGAFASEFDGGVLRICAIGSDAVTWNMMQMQPTTGWSAWRPVAASQCQNLGGPSPF